MVSSLKRENASLAGNKGSCFESRLDSLKTRIAKNGFARCFPPRPAFNVIRLSSRHSFALSACG